MIRVLVAASSAVVRAGLESLVSSSPAVQVVGQAASLATVRQRAAAVQPDVVLLEHGPHDADDPIALATDLGSNTSLIILADMPNLTWAADLLRAGVRAVLPRDATIDEIAAAVNGAAAGFVMLSPATAGILLPLGPSRSIMPAPLDTALTPREIEVLTMLAEGVGNKTIARRLHISEHTVKFHVGSILTKLNAASRTEAVTLGARRGLIML